MPLPVLMISCPGVNCLITLGSTLIGETDDSPAVPIAPNGPCYLTITPLVQPQEGVLLPLGHPPLAGGWGPHRASAPRGGSILRSLRPD